jgi:hypothetical protein
VKKAKIREIIRDVNQSLIHYKRGGCIDCRRTPNSSINMVNTIEEYVDARFNRECWEVPELREACDLLEGHLFICTLEGVDEVRKRYKTATLKLVSPTDILDPTPELENLLKEVKIFLGGNKIKFNGLKYKVKFEILFEE